ncbi:MarR family transcriptional regulator [Bifidobacterium parmae]|uniref:HTH marR-type domain-containing protein n=1 Tax=Bifidobacterium parmae TaxID=361854 RepID=A0A2N5J3S3_9BIFI|nr:MarR family transcriptional regulator [Bifidobacterium parmae]PLS28872.1 hypothetical protein Uis4E_1015 [Bifidobacterium parmae]
MDTAEYIHDAFGLACTIEPWETTASLPMFLTADRRFDVLDIGDTRMLLVDNGARPFRITDLIDDTTRISRRADLPVVLAFPRLSTYQRKALISNHLPFIVPGAQLYIPALGMLFSNSLTPKSSHLTDKEQRPFPPSTQLVWLHLLYHVHDHPGKGWSQSDVAATLHIDEALVSNAAATLELQGLIHRTKHGRRKIIELTKTSGGNVRLALLERSWHRLTNPVFDRRTAVCRKHDTGIDIPEGLVYAGEFATAQRTDLATPRRRTFAGERRWVTSHDDDFRYFDAEVETIPNDAFTIERWKYDPRILTQDPGRRLADPISVALSLGDIADERLEDAVRTAIRDALTPSGR